MQVNTPLTTHARVVGEDFLQPRFWSLVFHEHQVDAVGEYDCVDAGVRVVFADRAVQDTAEFGGPAGLGGVSPSARPCHQGHSQRECEVTCMHGRVWVSRTDYNTDNDFNLNSGPRFPLHQNLHKYWDVTAMSLVKVLCDFARFSSFPNDCAQFSGAWILISSSTARIASHVDILCAMSLIASMSAR